MAENIFDTLTPEDAAKGAELKREGLAIVDNAKAQGANVFDTLENGPKNTESQQESEQSFLDASADTLNTLVAGASNEVKAGILGLFKLAASKSPDEAAKFVDFIKQDMVNREITPRSQAQLQDIGGAVQAVTENVVTPALAGVTGLTQLAEGEGLDQAVKSIQDVQEKGFIRASGDETLRETDSPAAAAAVEAGLNVLPDIVGLKAARSTAKAANKAVDSVLDKSSPIVGDVTDKAVDVVSNIQTPKRRSLTEALKKTDDTGELDISTAGFELSTKGKAVRSPLERKALKHHVSEQFITSLKTASKGDKLKIKEMVNITKRRLKDPDFALDNRPSDVIGEVVLERFRTIKNANKRAGKEIDVIADSLKNKPIDIEDAVLKFDSKLDEFGINLIDDGKGGLKPDFSLSELPPSDRGAIKEVVRQMNLRGKNGVDAYNAHKMKRIIDRSISYGKTQALSSDGQKMLRDFRKGIDDALDFTYPKYNRANTDYSDTIRAIDALQDALPNKIDLDAPNAETAIGTDLRSLLSNNTSRQEKLNALKIIDDTANKYSANGKLLLEGKGGVAPPSIKKLIVAVDQLEDRFGSFAPTSFQGGIERGTAQGIGRVAEAKTSPVTAAMKATAEVTDKVRRITDENTFNSLEELLNK